LLDHADVARFNCRQEGRFVIFIGGVWCNQGFGEEEGDRIDLVAVDGGEEALDDGLFGTR
jgi:hypothetical protein